MEQIRERLTEQFHANVWVDQQQQQQQQLQLQLEA
jgi:hypothetical protein